MKASETTKLILTVIIWVTVAGLCYQFNSFGLFKGESGGFGAGLMVFAGFIMTMGMWSDR